MNCRGFPWESVKSVFQIYLTRTNHVARWSLFTSRNSNFLRLLPNKCGAKDLSEKNILFESSFFRLQWKFPWWNLRERWLLMITSITKFMMQFILFIHQPKKCCPKRIFPQLWIIIRIFKLQILLKWMCPISIFTKILRLYKMDQPFPCLKYRMVVILYLLFFFKKMLFWFRSQSSFKYHFFSNTRQSSHAFF